MINVQMAHLQVGSPKVSFAGRRRPSAALRNSSVRVIEGPSGVSRGSRRAGPRTGKPRGTDAYETPETGWARRSDPERLQLAGAERHAAQAHAGGVEHCVGDRRGHGA